MISGCCGTPWQRVETTRGAIGVPQGKLSLQVLLQKDHSVPVLVGRSRWGSRELWLARVGLELGKRGSSMGD